MQSAQEHHGYTSEQKHSAPCCAKCGYDLRGTQAADCPECGFTNTAGNVLKTLYRPWVYWYCVALVVLTFGLMILGGTVTSRGAALAVPDWPTSYGYNLFLFPPSMWQGNIFWEHTHRLWASGIGLMCIGISIILITTQRRRRWLWLLGLGILGLVCFQGLMGGLRVTRLSVWLGVFHGIHGQMILCLTVLVAAANSRLWIERNWSANRGPNARVLRRGALAVLAVVLIQLVLGTGMRHHEAGLAIPDFPTAYGSWWPPMQQEQIESAMVDYASHDDRFEFMDRVFTPGQVAIAWTHRLWAIAVTGICIWMFVMVYRHARHNRSVVIPAVALGLLLMSQVALGISVIWSSRHPELATAHQSVGAALLAVTAWLAIRIYLPQPVADPRRQPNFDSKLANWPPRSAPLATENRSA